MNGALVLGWTPALWWVHWPVGFDHAAFVLALLSVALVVLPASSAGRRMRPELHRVDLLVAMTAGAGLLVVRTFASVASPQRALSLLLPGYDHSAHFDMFLTARRLGSTTPTPGSAPDGSSWAFGEYPQGYHSLLAMHAQLAQPTVGSSAGELVAYAHAVAGLTVFALVVLVAAVCSVPRLRARPLVALPVVVLVCTAYLWRPGARVLADGFGNFWFCAMAVSCALVLALSARRPALVAESAAIGGLLMVSAHAWTPLTILAAPAALVVLRRGPGVAGRRSGAAWLSGVGLLCLAGAGASRAVLAILRQVKVNDVVTASGGGQSGALLPALILVVVSTYLVVRLSSWLGGRPVGSEDHTLAGTVRSMLWTPLVGSAFLVLLLVAQLRTLGTTAYYFDKYVVGLELVLVPLTATLCGLLVAAFVPVRRRRVHAVTVSIVLAAGATQILGHLAWRDVSLVSPPSSLPDHTGVPVSLRATAVDLLAASSTAPAGGHGVDYLTLRPDRSTRPYLPDVWFHALSGGLTTETFSRMQELNTLVAGTPQAAAVVRRLLAAGPDTSVVVAPELLTPLRRELGAPDLAARVGTWPGRSVEAQGER